MPTAGVTRVVCMLAVAVLAAGCDKKVKLTFVNTTPQSLNVELNVPTEGPIPVGTVYPTGGKLVYNLKINKDDLPVDCQWRAGDQSGNFPIDNKTRSPLYIYIGTGDSIGPVDKNAEINKKTQTEIKDMPVEQYEVVQ